MSSTETYIVTYLLLWGLPCIWWLDCEPPEPRQRPASACGRSSQST